MPTTDPSSTEPSPLNPRRDELDALLRPPPSPPWWTWRPASWGDPRPNLSRVAMAALAAVTITGGAVAYRSMTSRPAAVELPRADVAASPDTAAVTSGSPTGAPADASPGGAPGDPTDAPPTSVVVQVAGAVGVPGVVTIASGARWNDAIAAAGGPNPDADLDRVNLAAIAVDGTRLFVPRRGEEPPGEVPATASAGDAGPSGAGAGERAGAASASAPIDLNLATAEQLDTLPGVGPSTAAAILEHRERSGPFRSVDELDEVAGIGPTRLERLRPLVRVG